MIGKLMTDIRDLKMEIVCLLEKRRIMSEALQRSKEMLDTEHDPNGNGEYWRDFAEDLPAEFPSKDDMVDVVKRLEEAQNKLARLEARKEEIGI